ncbi:hypothetical protein [Deinococcus wulumuqiensis]|uniref:hypothetical protein n=1 Tax=Deinococcus wulumuqiensis TaxID=980427 RepID=UPI0013C30320|nr:hypothetical protein [Deinococcus wulumuqiensis]
MIRLPTTEHAPGLAQRLSDGASGVTRTAVKAVIRREGHLWLLHSPPWACYKFPGGVESGESHAQEPDAEVYRMDSLYFACEVTGGQHAPQLEAYEAELDLSPYWATPDGAVQANEAA